MTQQEKQWLDLLSRKSPCVPMEYVAHYYGLKFGDHLRKFFDRWKATAGGAERCAGGLMDRIKLETFLQNQKMLPYRWMAAELGMQEHSLRELLARRDEVGLVPEYEYLDELVLESLKDDLLRAVKSLRFRTFGSHRDFCERLHKALRDDFNIAIEELWCATSEEMGESPRMYASHFDCLTLRPLSIKHSVWLDFRKPLSLPPDRCSKLLLARNLDDLTDFVAGTGLPDLSAYEALTGAK